MSGSNSGSGNAGISAKEARLAKERERVRGMGERDLQGTVQRVSS